MKTALVKYDPAWVAWMLMGGHITPWQLVPAAMTKRIHGEFLAPGEAKSRQSE